LLPLLLLRLLPVHLTRRLQQRLLLPTWLLLLLLLPRLLLLLLLLLLLQRQNPLLLLLFWALLPRLTLWLSAAALKQLLHVLGSIFFYFYFWRE
jgi:hypothetical protein